MILDGSASGWSKEDGLSEGISVRWKEVDDMSDGLYGKLLSSVGLDRDRNGVYDVCLTMMSLHFGYSRHERRV
jgi:hypothetical protein